MKTRLCDEYPYIPPLMTGSASAIVVPVRRRHRTLGLLAAARRKPTQSKKSKKGKK